MESIFNFISYLFRFFKSQPQTTEIFFIKNTNQDLKNVRFLDYQDKTKKYPRKTKRSFKQLKRSSKSFSQEPYVRKNHSHNH